MLLALNQNALTTVVGSVLVFTVTGYLQYLFARGLREEIIVAKRRGKFRGYLFGLSGMFAFAAFVQMLFVLSVLKIKPPHWSGLLLCLVLCLIVVAFLVGNRTVGKVIKKRRL